MPIIRWLFACNPCVTLKFNKKSKGKDFISEIVVYKLIFSVQSFHRVLLFKRFLIHLTGTVWQMRRWCSGIMQDSHSCDPGSIPGRRMSILLFIWSISNQFDTLLHARDPFLFLKGDATKQKMWNFPLNTTPRRGERNPSLQRHLLTQNCNLQLPPSCKTKHITTQLKYTTNYTLLLSHLNNILHTIYNYFTTYSNTILIHSVRFKILNEFLCQFWRCSSCIRQSKCKWKINQIKKDNPIVDEEKISTLRMGKIKKIG